jgi:hypothetical protein
MINDRGGQANAAVEISCHLIKSGSYPAPVLQPAKVALNHIPFFI